MHPDTLSQLEQFTLDAPIETPPLNEIEDINRADEFGKTPLYYAVAYGHTSLAYKFIRAGANANIMVPMPKGYGGEKDTEGQEVPLLHAWGYEAFLSEDKKERFFWLLEQKIDFTVKDAQNRTITEIFDSTLSFPISTSDMRNYETFMVAILRHIPSSLPNEDLFKPFTPNFSKNILALSNRTYPLPAVKALSSIAGESKEETDKQLREHAEHRALAELKEDFKALGRVGRAISHLMRGKVQNTEMFGTWERLKSYSKDIQKLLLTHTLQDQANIHGYLSKHVIENAASALLNAPHTLSPTQIYEWFISEQQERHFTARVNKALAPYAITVSSKENPAPYKEMLHDQAESLLATALTPVRAKLIKDAINTVMDSTKEELIKKSKKANFSTGMLYQAFTSDHRKKQIHDSVKKTLEHTHVPAPSVDVALQTEVNLHDMASRTLGGMLLCGAVRIFEQVQQMTHNHLKVKQTLSPWKQLLNQLKDEALGKHPTILQRMEWKDQTLFITFDQIKRVLGKEKNVKVLRKYMTKDAPEMTDEQVVEKTLAECMKRIGCLSEKEFTQHNQR